MTKNRISGDYIKEVMREIWDNPPSGDMTTGDIIIECVNRIISNIHAKWMPIDSAPKDGSEILLYAPSRDGLSDLQSVCAWHPDAGFCIDEIREPTHWRPLPLPPTDLEE